MADPDDARPRDGAAPLRRVPRGAGSVSCSAGSASTATTPPARAASSSAPSPTACPSPRSRSTPDRGAELRCAAAVIRASGAFDAEGYAEANRLATRRVDPLQHFVEEGWRDLRAPSLDFDLWWYTCAYLDPTARGRQPAAALPARRPPRGARAGARPTRRARPDPLRRGAHPAARLPVRGVRPRRHPRRLRRALPARAEPVRRRLLPRRRRPRPRRARQARRRGAGRVEHPARGVRLRLLVAAGPRPRRLGAPGRATTR